MYPRPIFCSRAGGRYQLAVPSSKTKTQCPESIQGQTSNLVAQTLGVLVGRMPMITHLHMHMSRSISTGGSLGATARAPDQQALRERRAHAAARQAGD